MNFAYLDLDGKYVMGILMKGTNPESVDVDVSQTVEGDDVQGGPRAD